MLSVGSGREHDRLAVAPAQFRERRGAVEAQIPAQQEGYSHPGVLHLERVFQTRQDTIVGELPGCIDVAVPPGTERQELAGAPSAIDASPGEAEHGDDVSHPQGATLRRKNGRVRCQPAQPGYRQGPSLAITVTVAESCSTYGRAIRAFAGADAPLMWRR